MKALRYRDSELPSDARLYIVLDHVVSFSLSRAADRWVLTFVVMGDSKLFTSDDTNFINRFLSEFDKLESP